MPLNLSHQDRRFYDFVSKENNNIKNGKSDSERNFSVA